MSSTCSICSEVYDDDVSASRCGHVFHNGCISVWLQQKRTCPLCKANISSAQTLTPLRFSPKRKLRLLQDNSSSSSSSTDSVSPFTLSIRLQALQQQREDLKLRALQLSTSCASLRTAVTSLQSSLSAATQRRSQLEQQLQVLDAGLDPLEQEVSSRRTQWRRLQRVHDWKWRHLLVINGMRNVKRAWRSGRSRDRDRDRSREMTATEAKAEGSRRGGAGGSSEDEDAAEEEGRWFVDVERVVRQEESRMPVRRLEAADCEADEEEEDGRRRSLSVSVLEPEEARREAMDLLLRVLLSEVRAQLEAAKREYKETVKDRREAAQRMRREEAAVNRERKEARDRRDALLQERMTLHGEKQNGRREMGIAQADRQQQPTLQQQRWTERDAESGSDDNDVIVLSG